MISGASGYSEKAPRLGEVLACLDDAGANGALSPHLIEHLTKLFHCLGFGHLIHSLSSLSEAPSSRATRASSASILRFCSSMTSRVSAAAAR